MEQYMDRWIEKRWDIDSLTEDKIREYQWNRIKETIDYAVANSPFYREKFKDHTWKTWEDFSWLPYTLPEELEEFSEEMVAVDQKHISRIVTLETSGTTGKSKRVYFTEEDQEETTDFFCHGMQYLLEEGDSLLILMPYKRPGSVGDLLRQGVERLGIPVKCLGPIDEDLSYNTILDIIYRKNITCIVGLPSQIHQLMKHTTALTLKNVLLSGEYVSPMVVRDLQEIWNCQVFEHYGMTEMGLGGAVSCSQRKGYHIRENHLYIEIIDPANGETLIDGKWGEVVVTTLTRRGMPLIRYRTGDESRIINKKCECGSVLRRLDRVKSRELLKGWV